MFLFLFGFIFEYLHIPFYYIRSLAHPSGSLWLRHGGCFRGDPCSGCSEPRRSSSFFDEQAAVNLLSHGILFLNTLMKIFYNSMLVCLLDMLTCYNVDATLKCYSETTIPALFQNLTVFSPTMPSRKG